MKHDEVKFTKFSVNPEDIITSLPQYKSHWPASWTVVCVSRQTSFSTINLGQSSSLDIHTWLKEQATAKTDIFPMPNGDTLIGFEDESDALLFKISINGAV